MSKQQTLPRKPAGIASDTLNTVGLVIALGTFFATVPLATHDDDAGAAWWLIALAIGSSLLLTGVVVRMFRRSGNLFRLLALLLIVAVVCALGIYTVATELPGQFAGIETRIDALYFTLTTMTTTGYGDIHAVGQLARIIVSFIFLFDLVFLGLVGVELSRIAQRKQDDSEAPDPVSADPHNSAVSHTEDELAAPEDAPTEMPAANREATVEVDPAARPPAGQPAPQPETDGTVA